jgi:hypothetical protein
MTRSLKGMMTAAALFAVAACSDAGTPVEPASSFAPVAPVAAKSNTQLTFSNTTSTTSAQPESATGGAGRIDFTGSLQTPTPCYNVTATHSASEATVTVTVSASPNGQACIQVIAQQNYTGAVTGLAPGIYTFTLVHKTPDGSAPAYTAPVIVT